VSGKLLGPKASAHVSNKALAQQHYRAQAVYEDPTNFNIFRMSGYRQKYATIVPEYLLAFNVDACGINKETIMRNLAAAQNEKFYHRIGGACPEFICQAVIRDYTPSTMVLGMSCQAVAHHCGRDIVRRTSDKRL